MKIIDRLRTKYKNLPAPMRRLASAFVRFLPEDFKYGKRYKTMREVLKKIDTDQGFACTYQDDTLRDILILANQKSLYFRSVFEAVGITSSNLEKFSIQDLSKLPISDKNTIRQSLENLTTLPLEKLDLVTTSGSSGTPLRFYLNKDRSVTEWAFLTNAWKQVGFTTLDIRAALRGFEIPNVDERPWEFEAGLRELRLSPFHMNSKWLPIYVNEIQKRRIQFLHGYPSAIEIIARYASGQGFDDFRHSIKGIILTSEALYDHQAALFRKTFPSAQILSFYGLSEKILFATSDPEDLNTFTFNPAYGIAELVDENGATIVEPGSKGRIIGTGLQFGGMPFIRYDTGDVAELVEAPTNTNGRCMVVKNISPRRGQDILVGKGGELISMTALNIHSDAYTSMKEFVVVQDAPGFVLIKAVLAQNKTVSDVEGFVTQFSEKTGNVLNFELKIVDEISAGARGKRHWVQQNIDLSKYTQ